jgi:hypothetical protein
LRCFTEKLKQKVDAMELFLNLRFPTWRDDVSDNSMSSKSPTADATSWTLTPSKNATLSNGNLTLTKTGGGRTGWDCNVLVKRKKKRKGKKKKKKKKGEVSVSFCGFDMFVLNLLNVAFCAIRLCLLLS